MADMLDHLRTVLADRYAIEREVGAGGMATVYLAEDLKHHRQVALKVLRPELSAALGPERFLREIEIAAKLAHPHILPLYDSGAADGFLYYVMPYVEGESLRQRLEREKQLPIDDALKIAQEVGDALSFAHAHGVIHRDIKPENILFEGGHAVVADFGIARAVTAAGGEGLTETGMTIGTPKYMSPEQAAGSRELDGRSDLYSLGCVLYEMLAGQPPFTGSTAASVIAQHLMSEPPNVTAIRPAVPADIVGVLARALAKTAADRFSPVGVFVEALAKRESAGMVAARMPVTRPALGSWRRPALLGLVLVVAVGAALVVGRWIGGTPAREPGHPRTAIAVLPFQNLSADGPYAYFASGLQDEVLTQLAKVAALKVISRTSAAGYVGASLPPLRQIASELGVGSVVEGSVQVMGDRLRVNVQLLDATTDEHLWAESYDRTLDDAFAIQSDVAQQVVTAVGAALGGSEQQALAQAPTANAEAYRLYLQGLEYYRRPGYLQQNFESAQQLYERAIALDSTFALAHTALSQVHGNMSWLRYDTSPERLVRQREEAETALRLAPELPQAHIAMGLVHYRGRRDWQAALDEYSIALQDLPNDARVWTMIAAAHRRLGHWDEVDAAYEKATQLDPRNATLFSDLGGGTFSLTRRYAEAVAAYNRAYTLAPDLKNAAVQKGLVYLDWKGELDTLRAVLEQLPPDAAFGAELGTARAQRALLLLLERKPDSLLAVLGSARDAVFESQMFFLPTSLYAAWAHELHGNGVAARATFESARSLLDSVLPELPDDWRVHAARGLALAGLGRQQEALREARWLERSVVYRKDAYDSRYVAEERARILAQAGEVDAALREIEQLLAGPGNLSVYRLRLDPRWDPIRAHPRFQRLLERYGS
jgi:eukaryotic-like serine/threonine-protein kinase